MLYDDLLKIANEKEVQNAKNDALFEALRKGKVYYDNAQIKGEFNARIAKVIRGLGGTYNRKSKTYSMPNLPIYYRQAIAQANAAYDAMKKAIDAKLASVSVESVSGISTIPNTYIATVAKMNNDFEIALKGVSIPPELTDDMRNTIASEWGQNLDLYIRGWLEKDIIKLRDDVQKAAFEGQRVENLAKFIEAQYDVSLRKAKFLARQETSLLMSKFHESRYKDMGITRYIWDTAGDERVRESHKELNGKEIYWDRPPVVDKLTGRRAHAGEDFNCRCVPRAIID